MRLVLGSGLLLSTFVALVACGAGSSPEPSPFQAAPTLDPELAALDLDITADELVADEAASEAEYDALAWPAGSEPQEEGSAPDDLLDQAELDPSVPDELPDPPLGLGQETGPDFSSVSLRDAPIDMPSGAARAWWSRSYGCARNPLGASCVCRGSRYNCQFPNSQPGRNRYLPPAAMQALRRVTGPKTRVELIEKLGKWGVLADTPIYDGAGHLRGRVLGSCYALSPSGAIVKDERGHPCVKVNFGQLKTMVVDGSSERRQYVYAFDVGISPAPRPGNAGGSSWIPAANIVERAFKRYDTPPRSSAAFAETDYVVKSASDYGCAQDGYDSSRCLPAWAQLKIRPRSGPNVSEKARDYLLRDGNTLNLAYQTPLLGGAATDTFLVTPMALGFQRVRSVDPERRTLLRISLFELNGTKPVRTMIFVFGRIEGRFGWVGAEAIKKGKKRGPCQGKANGAVCDAVGTGWLTCKDGQVARTDACPAGQRCTDPGTGPLCR